VTTASKPRTPAGVKSVATALFAALALWCVPTGAKAEDVPEKLTRREALRRGAEKNLGLLSSRLIARRQELLSRAAWQAYSPTVVLDAAWERSEADAFGREHLLEYGAGVAWKTPVGTTLSARLDATQGLAGVASADGAQSGRSTDGELSLGLSQPLLKGGWLEGAGLPLREAALSDRIQRELFRDELNALLADVEAAYWDLAVAEADLAIKTRSRDRAKQQYEDTAENIRRGILAAGEIYVVEENVVFFEQELLRAEQTLRLARRRLAEQLLLPPDGAISAADELAKPELDLPAREAAIDEGLRTRPKLLAQALRGELASARLSFAGNQALPSLDLAASLALDGSDERYGDAWRKAFGEPTVAARVGLVFGLPLDRSAIRAGVDAAGLEVRRQEADLEAMRLSVRFEIDNGLADLEVNVRLLGLAQKSVELAELKLSTELEKYKTGVSTLVDVVRFQRDLDNALIGLQRVNRAVRVGRARLLAAQGTLHQAAGVEVR